KAATNDVLAGGPPDLPLGSLDDLLAQVQPGDYVAIQAYVDPGDERLGDLEEARLRIRDEHKVATTFGLGPRFLHSTGQLHKGGPPTGVFVQVLGDDVADSQVPDQSFTFGELKHAQADGDLLTLRKHGLRAERVRAQDLIDDGCLRSAGMKLGMIGRGKMGGNMAERLRRHGHDVVGMDPSADGA